MSSRTIAELLPCVDAPSEEHSVAALERVEEERGKLSAHIGELVRTRDALDAVMVAARAALEDLLEVAGTRVVPGGR